MNYVRYIGLSHARIITAQDWRSVGINGDTVVWSAQNGFAVATDVFTEEQIEKAIDPDPEFVITGNDEEFKPSPQNRDMTPAQVVQITEAPVDVVDMLNNPDDGSTTDSGPNPGGGTAKPSRGTTGRGSGHDEPR
jgi:hypothetical protein